jgi:hypothetical protein
MTLARLLAQRRKHAAQLELVGAIVPRELAKRFDLPLEERMLVPAQMPHIRCPTA